MTFLDLIISSRKVNPWMLLSMVLNWYFVILTWHPLVNNTPTPWMVARFPQLWGPTGLESDLVSWSAYFIFCSQESSSISWGFHIASYCGEDSFNTDSLSYPHWLVFAELYTCAWTHSHMCSRFVLNEWFLP